MNPSTPDPAATQGLPSGPDGPDYSGFTEAEFAALYPTEPVAGITTVLQALGDPVRMTIVRGLAGAGSPRICRSFAEELGLTKSTLSHHFKVLREAGIVDMRLEGTSKFTTLRREALDGVYPGLLDSILRGAETREPSTTTR